MHDCPVGTMERSTGSTGTSRDQAVPVLRPISQPVAHASRRPRSPPELTSGDFWYYVDTHGRQHFNFPQRVWLRASVDMAVTPVMTLALETLAINLLTHLTRERDYRAAVGFTSSRAVKLARRFCRECLLTAQAEGWVMPRATLKEWFTARTRAQRRM